jgi:plastocyanin
MRRLPRACLVASIVLAGVACSGSSDSPEPCTPAGPTATVDLQDFVFAPTCIQATAGGSLHLDNTGDALHSFTVEETDATADVAGGEQGDLALTGVAAGTYAVICTYHPQMTATLEVVAG